MNTVKIYSVALFALMGAMLITASYMAFQQVMEKKNIVRICPDGTRIYRYSDGRFMAVGTGWGSTTETVPGPEICDK
jgi:hypothetical protein